MEKQKLQKYAETAIKMGLNVQVGQDVMINATLNYPEFTMMCVEEAYKAGARKVSVEWNYQELSKLKSIYESIETLSEFNERTKSKLDYQLEKLPAILHIISEDPEGLLGADQEKLAKSRALLYPNLKPYLEKLDEQYQWCIIGVPCDKWATKCFPNLTLEDAKEALWEKILHTARITDDPVKAWTDHNNFIHSKCDILNNLDIESLEYKNSLGTDFKIDLIPNGLFLGGSETLRRLNIEYNPNMPTEECFTTPNKNTANGTLVSTLPLSYNGQLIKDFKLTFENGKVVKAEAKENEELLKQMLQMDEGASYLGEVALVPFSSPINQTGILFYNTLYDENAVCHFALGRGFSNTIKDFTNYGLEEIRNMGVNDSLIHVDFMVGSSDLNIVANTRDGKKVQIFRDGEWAI